jgi:serine/threonine protein kinase
MLCPNPDERPTAAEALCHPWFKQDEDAIRALLSMNNDYATNNPRTLTPIAPPFNEVEEEKKLDDGF